MDQTTLQKLSDATVAAQQEFSAALQGIPATDPLVSTGAAIVKRMVDFNHAVTHRITGEVGPVPIAVVGLGANYPSIENLNDTPLRRAYYESLTPRQAELFLLSPPLRAQAFMEAFNAGVQGLDTEIMRDNEDVDATMQRAAKASVREVPAFSGNDPAGSHGMCKRSTNPADFPHYDGGGKMRELWVKNPGASTSPLGVDATAYTINNTGNPKFNTKELWEFEAPEPGKNGCRVRVNKYGFRIPKGTQPSDEDMPMYWYQGTDMGGGQYQLVLSEPAA